MKNNIWKNRNFKPMLLEEIDNPFNDKDYIYEIKFDGIRAIIFVNKKEIKIMSRNNKDITNLFPEFKTLSNTVNENTIFDGEICILEQGKPSFSKLQERLHLKNKNKIEKLSYCEPSVFIAFDILYKNKDLTNLPLHSRKKILNEYVDNDIFYKSKIFKDGIKLFKKIKKLSLEGIVAKNINGLYHINERTDDFIKIKNWKSDIFYICGYKKNIKDNSISLILGEYKNKEIYYVGKVRLMNNNSLYNKIIKSKNIKSNIKGINEDDIIFIKNQYKCEVEFMEKTKSGMLRQPIFKKEVF